MRLAVNGLRLAGPFTGVPRYLVNLLRQWNRDPGKFRAVDLLTQRRWEGGLPHGAVTQKVLSPPLGYSAAEQLLMRRCNADVLFCPANTMPWAYRGRCVVTVHDVMQHLAPQWFGWWGRVRHGPLYRYSARRARRVITDSHNSKRDIVRVYGVDEDDVTVVPLAADPCFRPCSAAAVERTRKRFGLLDAPYVLFVGKLSVRRNIPMLIEAFAQAVRRESLPHRLVLVGVNHLKFPLEAWAESSGLSGRWTHIEFATDDELMLLYNGADCFVYPSSYEGFGLPPLEAMSCGCPVILFRNSSLTEVGGDAAHFAEPESAEGLCKALGEVLTSESCRQRLRSRGLQQAARFSWEHTARQTLRVLEEVCRD